jgi:hypothetical protein
MRIDILTLFPEMFSAMQESILGRAQKEKNKTALDIILSFISVISLKKLFPESFITIAWEHRENQQNHSMRPAEDNYFLI